MLLLPLGIRNVCSCLKSLIGHYFQQMNCLRVGATVGKSLKERYLSAAPADQLLLECEDFRMLLFASVRKSR